MEASPDSGIADSAMEMEMEMDDDSRSDSLYCKGHTSLNNNGLTGASTSPDEAMDQQFTDDDHQEEECENDVDWDALKVVDTIEELQHCLRENRHCNLLVLPTCSSGSSSLPMTTATSTATTSISPMTLPLRQFVTPAVYCSMVADALQSNTALTSLALEEVTLVNPVASSIAPLYQPQPQLFWLGQSIASHPHLTRLTLVDNRLGDAGVIALMQAWSLFQEQDSTSASASASMPSSTTTRHGFRLAPPVPMLLPASRIGSCLQSLSLRSNRIGDQGAFWIAQALLKKQSLNNLSELDLSSNDISKEGAVSLANLICNSRSLTTLLLSGNAIGPEGAASLAQALQQENSQMTILGLSSNGIQDKGASAMARAISQHSCLQAVLLEDNLIGPQGYSAVVQAYLMNPRLGMMELSGNQPLPLSVLPGIASAMTTLRYLYLDRCGLQDSHTQCVAKVLRTNTTVLELFLEGNQIGPLGAINLASALETNSTLEGLFLEGNPIETAGARALCETLKSHNMTMRRLPIGPVKKKNAALLVVDGSSSGTLHSQQQQQQDYQKIQQEMEVYLDMNTSGRRRVLQSGLPPAMWCYFLQREDILFDPSMMFLFHKEHPQIFQNNNTKGFPAAARR